MGLVSPKVIKCFKGNHFNIMFNLQLGLLLQKLIMFQNVNSTGVTHFRIGNLDSSFRLQNFNC